MFNTDEAVDYAASDIARNGPFPRAEAMRADDDLYRELGNVARQRVEEARWRVAQEQRNHLIRAGVAVVALTFVALAVLGVFAVRSEETSPTTCPPPAKSCKVLVLTPEEEQALMQPRGVLDTAREGRPLDLGQIVAYFRERISRAPAGTVPAEAVPVPQPRPPEAPQESKP